MPTSEPHNSLRSETASSLDLSVSTPTAILPPQLDRQAVSRPRLDEARLRTRCLHERFEAQAAATPLAEALVVGVHRVSYRELNERANRIAHRLLSLGVGPETLIGVYLERSADLVASLLGILKAGAAYVPLDPIYPNDRLSFILRDTGMRVVLTEDALHDTLRRTAASIAQDPICLCVDTDEQLAFAAVDNPPLTTTPDHLAYVLYTPGTTDPKGVAIEHRNVVTFVQWAGDLYSPRELSGVLACTSICFDPSILELFVPLSFGGRVILGENILALRLLPAADEIRLLDTTPSVAKELLRIGGFPASLETINLGGEPVPDRLVRQLYALPHIQRVYDQYGPLETTTIATSVLRTPKEPANIGVAIEGTQIHLLDDEQRPVPPGAIGELCISGAGVARGYWNRPQHTALKFIPHPFSSEPGARLFRTGDLCRRRADNRFEYIGRADELVHLHGRQVELGKVEAALRTHPAVDSAMVMLREDVPGNPRLVAYVVPQVAPAAKQPTQAELNLAAELCRCLRARLPHRLLQVFFALLALFTMVSNGRAERISLHAAARMRVTDYTATSRTARSRTDDILVRTGKRLLAARLAAVSAHVVKTGAAILSKAQSQLRASPLNFQAIRTLATNLVNAIPSAPYCRRISPLALSPG